MRLPTKKLHLLQEAINGWLHRKAATKREMLSLIGKLAHACKVVKPGRIFLRRLIDLASSRTNMDHWIRINQEFQSDLMWWHLFLERWNRSSLLSSHTNRAPDIIFSSDASGAWGCGAVWQSHWFQCQWSPSWAGINIAIKELVPVVLAVAVWGEKWAHKHVLVQCDNMAVVACIHSQSSKVPTIMHLLRTLHFITAFFDINLTACHLPGEVNILADALSRNNLQVFFRQCPVAETQPTPIPQDLWDVVVAIQPDWLSPCWRTKLQSCSLWASPPQHSKCTPQPSRPIGSSAPASNSHPYQPPKTN